MAQVPDTDVTTISVGGSAYTIPFQYQNKSEVFVEVNGTPVAFDWINDGSISIVPAPPEGAQVRRFRNTLAHTVRHNFRNGVPFTPKNISENNDQLLYAVQEAIQDASAALDKVLGSGVTTFNLRTGDILPLAEDYSQYFPERDELGSAAYEDLVSSANDTTAGRVLRTGSGGLLASGGLQSTTLDMVAADGTGFYVHTNGMAGFTPPTGQTGGLVQNYVRTPAGSVAQAVQIYEALTGRIWIRGGITNVFGPWREVPTRWLRAATGALEMPISSKLAEHFSVKDFGALGDGVTDDTAAIKAAIAEVGAGTLWFPSGTYLISTALALPSNITLEGNATIKTTVGFIPTGSDPTKAHGSMLYTQQKSNVHIRGLTFDCVQTTVPAEYITMSSIVFQGCSDISVVGCRFIGNGRAIASIGCERYAVERNYINIRNSVLVGDGVIDNWSGWAINNNTFRICDNVIVGNGHGRWGLLFNGVSFGGVDYSIDNFVVDRNHVSGCTIAGIFVGARTGRGRNIRVSGNVINGAGATSGIVINNVDAALVSGNFVEGTHSTGIEVRNEDGYGAVGCTAVNVQHNILRNVANDGTALAIWVDASDSCMVQGNIITGTTHYYGIVIGAASTKCRVANNHITVGRGPVQAVFSNAPNYLDGTGYSTHPAVVSNASTAFTLQGLATTTGATTRMSLAVQITATIPGTPSVVEFTLPTPAQTFTQTTQVRGTAVSITPTSPGGGFVECNITNGKARLQVTNSVAGPVNYNVEFTYKST